MDQIVATIRNIPDFPRPGIQFKDITPLLADSGCFQRTIDLLADRHRNSRIDMVAGIEARGFVFASALAYALGAGTTLLRKPGKLPHAVYRQSYDLEYGSDSIEIHTDAFRPGQRVLLVDDLLATGGTVAAALRLVRENFSVEIVEVDFLIELRDLRGREKLPADVPVHALVEY